MLVTNSLPNSCLVNLIDMTLACEDANSKLVDVVSVAYVDNSKLVEVVTVADVDDKDRAGNSL